MGWVAEPIRHVICSVVLFWSYRVFWSTYTILALCLIAFLEKSRQISTQTISITILLASLRGGCPVWWNESTERKQHLVFIKPRCIQILSLDFYAKRRVWNGME